MRIRAYLVLLMVLVWIGPAPGPPAEAEVGADPAERILRLALGQSRAYEKLAYLTDHVGHRLSGSAALDRAIEWAVAELRRDGLAHVWTETVLVPHWVRGEEAARILSPAEHEMAVLALGGSLGTPPGGLSAEVVLVSGFEELESLGPRVEGKIVLYHKPMERGFATENGYGSVAPLRVRGAAEAARRGAVGMLIRSLGTADFRLPHTGGMRHAEGVREIPAAAVAAEDADLIQRLIAAGETVRVRMELGARTLPDVESANVLAEIRGRERPDEIVLIGAHLDSWDVGTGAIDDGAGCAIVLETLRLLNKLDRPPRRTIRGVLFTNEENGLRGGRDYAERHADQLEKHVAAIESDSGGAAPLGFGVNAGQGALEAMRALARRLEPIGATEVYPQGGGADISPMRPHGVPQIALVQDPTHYFDYHHSAADTLDKVDRADLDRNVAAMALMAYLLADAEEPLPRLEIEEDKKGGRSR